MIHSCGINLNSKGLLFADFGGTGKSTTALLQKGENGVCNLNYDCVIIRKINGEFFIFGAPWPEMGDNAHPDSAPLEKIFVLRQAPPNKARQLSQIEAASALLARSFGPHWDATAMKFTLKFFHELCQQAPDYELNLLPDQSMVEYVRCL